MRWFQCPVRPFLNHRLKRTDKTEQKQLGGCISFQTSQEQGACEHGCWKHFAEKLAWGILYRTFRWASVCCVNFGSSSHTKKLYNSYLKHHFEVTSMTCRVLNPEGVREIPNNTAITKLLKYECCIVNPKWSPSHSGPSFSILKVLAGKGALNYWIADSFCL